MSEDARETASVPMLIEPGTTFEGLVSFRGAVRIEGVVIGEVFATGTLIVGNQGEMRGRVVADEVVVEGACDGEIDARRRIELRPTARVTGRMMAPTVSIADGSCFDGTWEVGGTDASDPTFEPPLRPDPDSRRAHGEAALSA